MGSAMLIEQEVTLCEMTSVHQLRAAPHVPGLALLPATDPAGEDAPRLRGLHHAVGAGHHWDSLGWSGDRWLDWLGAATRHHWYLTLHGVPVGVACLEEHQPVEVEIATFGLLPQARGHGCGGAALTELTRRAWALTVDAPGEPVRRRVERVWLQTTSHDHRNALANYLARGFEVCGSCTRRRRLPVGASVGRC